MSYLLLYSYENKKKSKGYSKNLVNHIYLGGFSDGCFYHFSNANALIKMSQISFGEKRFFC